MELVKISHHSNVDTEVILATNENIIKTAIEYIFYLLPIYEGLTLLMHGKGYVIFTSTESDYWVRLELR